MYYEIITEGLRDGKIIINENIAKSYVDIDKNVAYIRLYGNDSDLFIIVHELAHYIDRNSNPKIVPDDFDFLCEVFSFYMEKQLELWLPKEKYSDLISTRRNNRLYFESNMLKAVEYELYYEKLFRENGKIEGNEISIKKIKFIMKYDTAPYSTINYLMRYPLANVLTDYLLNTGFCLETEDLCEKCFQIDLYEALENWKKSQEKS